jgi:dipeptidyl aminopeptidase/acylaminoacyl peptidase
MRTENSVAAFILRTQSSAVTLLLLVAAMFTLSSNAAVAQGTLEDYRRAASVGQRYNGLTVGLVSGGVNWIDSTRAWYRVSVTGGNRFVLVDANAWSRQPAFDHDRLAAALSRVAGEQYSGITLPFTTFDYVNNRQAVDADAGGSRFRCTLTDYVCTRTGEAQTGRGGGAAGGRGAGRGGRGGGGRGGGAQGRGARGGGAGGGAATAVRASPDGRWEAFVQNANVFLRPAPGAASAPTEGRGSGSGTARSPAFQMQLSVDGADGNSYQFNSIQWSPDSKKLVAYRVKPGADRRVTYVLSSPADQVQPRVVTSNLYRKPGDTLNLTRPVLFDIESRTAFELDSALFSNAYQISTAQWRADSRAFTFEYNARGHMVYRVLEVNATSGAVRPIIDEETKSFFMYRPTNSGLSDAGHRFRRDLDDGREIIWMSERDGWAHLYLYDGVTGRLKNQITKGNWLVKSVDSVDAAKRQIWFTALGMNAGQDPYFLHYYRINFDGTGLVAYTEGNGTHSISWSPGRRFYIDTYSRVDMPPVVELRRTNDRRMLPLEKGDMSAALATGWRPPEVFVSKARDGVTDIWGIVVRPFTFDSTKRYPVIEQIYAGPQGSFVPKAWGGGQGLMSTAELGFVLVQIDGMGTNNRSKAFHDVAWKNLGDAGFPDRILWHKAVNAKYPWYDISRVGVYGTSAGGQNAAGAVLFHGDFYDAAFASSGCHDNRMDKIWWNELWMGEMGPHYEASSNVVHADKLRGKLFLAVGEYDTNVDPASTMQVVDALARAGKDFELLVVPNGGHGATGSNGVRKRNDFFMRSLHGINPPDWNSGLTVGRGGGAPGSNLPDFPEEGPPYGFFESPADGTPPYWWW